MALGLLSGTHSLSHSESPKIVRRLTLVQTVALVQVQHPEERYLSYHHISFLAVVNFGLLQ